MNRIFGVLALVLAVVAFLAAIWWGEARWQSAVTGGLMLLVGAALLGSPEVGE